MKGFTIIDQIQIDDKTTFLRIDPTDLNLTLKSIIESLADLSWITSFDNEYLKSGLKIRSENTIKYIIENIITENSDSVTSDSGEYIVSELARMTIVDIKKYKSIPLAELFKVKNIINHGFDFYSENLENVVLFGEAKYLSSQSAYGSAFKQIVEFEKVDKQDQSDIIDIHIFCSEESLDNFQNGKKGFMAAFSTKSLSTDKLIRNIKNNSHYLELKKFSELICVAVNL